NTSFFCAQLCSPSFCSTFLRTSYGAAQRTQHTDPVDYPARAAAFRSAGAPAPFAHDCRSNRLGAVAGAGAADSTHESSCSCVCPFRRPSARHDSNLAEFILREPPRLSACDLPRPLHAIFFAATPSFPADHSRWLRWTAVLALCV